VKDEQLNFLDSYLLSDRSPEDSMLLSDLDGFLTGIACSPQPILSDDWLPSVWRSGEAKDPILHQTATRLILEHYNDIVQLLNAEPSSIAPIFWEDQAGNTIAMDWCEGFMDACALQSHQWAELMQSEVGRNLMTPILAHIFDDEGESVLGIDEDDLEEVLDEASGQIVESVPLIFAYWTSRRERLH